MVCGARRKRPAVEKVADMAVIKKKIWKEYFDDVARGRKKFELRLADFDSREGDTLVLEEWDQDAHAYTGRTLQTTVTYVLKTKYLAFWPKEEIEKYGFQILQIEIKQ